MSKLAKKIADVLHDYHQDKGFEFTEAHVLKWVAQFEEEDQEFILTEFFHLLNQGIYISQDQARKLLINSIEKLSVRYKFKNVIEFLKNVEFLDLQPAGKSQSALLILLNEELISKYGIGLKQCGVSSKKYAVYVDDVLATGKTVFTNTHEWLEQENPDGESNFVKVVSGKKVFIVNVFCLHNWPNIDWRLRLAFNDTSILNKIKYECDYEIQNHRTKTGQRFNFAFPIDNRAEDVNEYYENLQAENYQEGGYRNDKRPTNETFFSSADNRNRFESVLLKKGIEILAKVATLKPNHRPLGATVPSHKTFGTGTLFFTWRNISNTTPVVFWWLPGGWYPLFPLENRGN